MMHSHGRCPHCGIKGESAGAVVDHNEYGRRRVYLNPDWLWWLDPLSSNWRWEYSDDAPVEIQRRCRVLPWPKAPEPPGTVPDMTDPPPPPPPPRKVQWPPNEHIDENAVSKPEPYEPEVWDPIGDQGI